MPHPRPARQHETPSLDAPPDSPVAFCPWPQPRSPPRAGARNGPRTRPALPRSLRPRPRHPSRVSGLSSFPASDDERSPHGWQERPIGDLGGLATNAVPAGRRLAGSERALRDRRHAFGHRSEDVAARRPATLRPDAMHRGRARGGSRVLARHAVRARQGHPGSRRSAGVRSLPWPRVDKARALHADGRGQHIGRDLALEELLRHARALDRDRRARGRRCRSSRPAAHDPRRGDR